MIRLSGCFDCPKPPLGVVEPKGMGVPILISLSVILLAFGAAWVLSGEPFGAEQMDVRANRRRRIR